MALTLVFIVVANFNHQRKERKSTAYHESAHALTMMATGMGFGVASIGRNAHVHGQISFQEVHYRINRTDSTAAFHTDDEHTRNMLMVMVAGYVAEAELAGLSGLNNNLKKIEGSDLQRADDILDKNPHLYSYTSKKEYLNEIISETKGVLAQHHDLHLLMSKELHASNTLSEEKAWELAVKSNSTLTHNPYLANLAFS